MKKRVFKTAFYFFIGFAVFFVFRLAYSFSDKTYRDDEDSVFDAFDEGFISRKNYASDSYKFKSEKFAGTAQASSGEMSVNQKYEKIANLAAKSEKYDDTEKNIRTQIKNFNCVIQFEQKTGNKGNRNLSLMLGVKPEMFDSLYNKLRGFGNIKRAEITKIDKTNEFRALNARKNSLEKTRNALIALKNQSGKIEEFISLEDRILAIEDTLQFLGVSLGDFDEENEFCTIKYSLNEGKPPVTMSFMHRVKVSLEWSIEFYFWFILVVIFIFVASFVLFFLINQLKIVQAVLKQNKQG
ncbi:MAG: hypothetical protein K0S32_3966 [Bacteroidetes bacterium]|jgi:hypothetical protein|nr:hypothetical protein [Bacteroidota bacterium]